MQFNFLNIKLKNNNCTIAQRNKITFMIIYACHLLPCKCYNSAKLSINQSNSYFFLFLSFKITCFIVRQAESAMQDLANYRRG